MRFFEATDVRADLWIRLSIYEADNILTSNFVHFMGGGGYNKGDFSIEWYNRIGVYSILGCSW